MTKSEIEARKSEKLSQLFGAIIELNGFEEDPKTCAFVSVSPHVAWISIDYYLDGWKKFRNADRNKNICLDDELDSFIQDVNQELFFINGLKRRCENARSTV